MEGGTPGLTKQRGLGRESVVASASSFCDYCQGTIHQRRPERSAQTVRRPPGSFQIALAWGEGALRHRHRLLGEGWVGHSGGWGGGVGGENLEHRGRVTAGTGHSVP